MSDCKLIEEMCCDTLTLYKYVTPAALKGLLEHGDIRISTKDSVNDPYELMVKGLEINKHYFNQYGFLSLSANAQSPPMWGNYANLYKGACIEFRIPYFSWKAGHAYTASAGMGEALRRLKIPVYPLLNSSNETKTTSPSILLNGKSIIKCRYINTRKSLQEIGINLKKSPFREKLKDWILIANFVRSKFAQWHYENEYRIIMQTKQASRHQYVNDNLMIFSNLLTPYIKRILLSPYSSVTAGVLQSAINTSEPLKKSTNIEVVQGYFSKTDFSLDKLDLGEQHIETENRDKIIYSIIELLETKSTEEIDKALDILQTFFKDKPTS